LCIGFNFGVFMFFTHRDRPFKLANRLTKEHLTALLVGLFMCGMTHAQTQADALNQRATAAMCANCHGTDGRVVQGSAIPALAGMPRDDMLLQLKEFKEGTRPATVMHQIAKGLTDAQVQAIASYYAKTPR
jgi:hypothetical protein